MNAANAYADLVAVARQISQPADSEPYFEFDADLTAQFVADHAKQLAAARRALSHPCRVEMRMEKSFYEEHWPETVALRNLIRLFANEVNLAATQANWPQVLGSSLDLLELGNAMRRGGMVLDMLVAWASCSIGIDLLRKHRTQFTDSQHAEIIRELLRLENECEPIEAIIARDRAWEIAAGYQFDPVFKPLHPDDSGLALEMQQWVHEAAVRESQLPPEQQRQQERGLDKFSQAMHRLLVVDLALRRFQHAHGSFPNRLHLLASKLLPVLPLDPFTNSPFIYRRHGDAFELYSPGPKQTDSGGSFGHKVLVLTGRADLCLDVRDYELPVVCEPECSGCEFPKLP